MSTNLVTELDDLRAELLGSYIYFCQVFFPQLTGREFIISQPMGRESHFITIAKNLTKISRQQQFDTIFNVPPGSGKSTLLSLWVGWNFAKYADCQFLYVSYSKTLATKHTEFIRRLLQLPDYMNLFDVRIKEDSRAKDSFQTQAGGSVKAFGAAGAITGQDAGLPGLDRFSGAVIIDDAHKPDEVHSDVIRESVIQNYKETILQRPRAPTVPIIFIGQRLHEDDLGAYLLSGEDERKYVPVVLPAIDATGNALYPEVNPLEQLLDKKEKTPYVFASQYQQDPIPPGGAVFKEHQFIFLDEEPEIILTFITADTAETSKTYNDATAFSFWGLYEIEEMGRKTGEYALHWLDCEEIRVEPKDLETSFRNFYAACMLHPVKPKVAAIEKKSTGATLCSVLQDMRGLDIREVQRTKLDGSKTVRFLEMQPYIASKQISFTYGAKHAAKCIQHMLKITANDSHKHDDICDTCYDAIKICLKDKTLYIPDSEASQDAILNQMLMHSRRRNEVIRKAYGHTGRR